MKRVHFLSDQLIKAASLVSSTLQRASPFISPTPVCQNAFERLLACLARHALAAAAAGTPSGAGSSSASVPVGPTDLGEGREAVFAGILRDVARVYLKAIQLSGRHNRAFIWAS